MLKVDRYRLESAAVNEKLMRKTRTRVWFPTVTLEKVLMERCKDTTGLSRCVMVWAAIFQCSIQLILLDRAQIRVIWVSNQDWREATQYLGVRKGRELRQEEADLQTFLVKATGNLMTITWLELPNSSLS